MTRGILALLLGFTLMVGVSRARDHGQWAQLSQDMRTWFNGLRSGLGPCCSDADGSVVQDPDWESVGGHFRVRISGEWLDVPDDAVILEPNRFGPTMVWPIPGPTGLRIRCFMPGSMT